MRLHGHRDLPDLFHHLRVDVQASGRVHDEDVAAHPDRLGEALLGHCDGVGGLGEDRHAYLPAEHAELLDGSGALQVGTHEQGVAALLLEPAGKLGGVGRLAGALQAGQQDDRGRPRGVRDPQRLAPERPDHFGVHCLHDLLARREAARELRPHQRRPQAADDVPHDQQVDVSLEEREADLPQRLVDVLLAEATPPTEAAEDGLEPVGKRLEHAAGHARGFFARPGHRHVRPMCGSCPAHVWPGRHGLP